MTLTRSDVAIVSGPRVQIRTFTPADVDIWQDWPDYPEPLLVGTSPRRMSPTQRARWYDDLVNRQRQLPFAVDDEKGTLIGRLFLRHVDEGAKTAVLGIDLHPDFLGRGYGTEALRLFLPYYFGALGLEKMLLSVAAHNERARRCYVGLGFTIIGSHWDAQPGPDVSRDPAYSHVGNLFRHSLLGLETLFHDMQLAREDWEAEAADAG